MTGRVCSNTSIAVCAVNGEVELEFAAEDVVYGLTPEHARRLARAILRASREARQQVRPEEN